MDANGSILILNNHAVAERFVTYTQSAIDSVFPRFGGIFVSFSLLFFVFTTVMAYYYYAETGIAYLFKKEKIQRIIIWVLRVCLLVAVFHGCIKQAMVAWQLGDIGVGIMAWINFLAILLLFPKAIKALRDYERQQKLGIDPIFDPKKLGIKNATYWEELNEKKKEESEIKD